jgi:hypothetical protein
MSSARLAQQYLSVHPNQQAGAKKSGSAHGFDGRYS